MDFIKFGEKVKEYRAKANLTQAELAEVVSSSAIYISYIERAIKRPSIEFTVRLADALNVTVDDLIK